jgi:hypothetical protein
VALTSPPGPRSSPLTGEERGRDGRAPLWLPVTAIPAPLLASPRWGEEMGREIPAGGRRWGDDPRWGEEIKEGNPRWGEEMGR